MFSYRLIIFFIILICFYLGHTLRCACEKDLRTCTSIYNLKVDFKTAQQICMEKGGKLLKPSIETIDSLLFNKTGNFWIGTKGDCLNSSRNSQGDSVNREKKDVTFSSMCILVSTKKTFTERLCKEQADGFLCYGIQWENCWEDKPTEVQILNMKDCLLGPCEHRCSEVPGGHMCSCLSKFRPSRKNPERCEYYCDSETCPLLNMQKCPDGFIKNEKECTDLDECVLHDNNCDQKCRNTFGSYRCSCYDGFVLVNRSKCVSLIYPTPSTGTFVTPSVNYTLGYAASTTLGEYIGLTLFLLLAISALAGLLYYMQKSKSEFLLKENDVTDNVTVQEV